MSICLPKPLAEELKNAIEAGTVNIDELAKKSTSDRRSVLETVFKDAITKKKVSFPKADIPTQADIDALLTQFNKGFEDRIVTSSRDIGAKIARQHEIITANKSASSVKRAENIIADLTGTQEQLLARQKKLLKDFVVRETSGLPKRTKKTTIEKIDTLKHALNPDEQKLFLEDMVSQRLGFTVTDETKATLFKLAEESAVARKQADEALENTQTAISKTFKTNNASRYDEVSKLEDKTIREAELRKLDMEAEDFADDVYLGKISPDNVSLTKSQFKEMERARIENMTSTQRLVDFIGAQEKLITTPKWKDIADADGFHAKTSATLRKVWDSTLNTSGALKSIIGSMDLSFVFRQGWVVALNNPKLYGKAIQKTLVETWQVLLETRKIGDELEGGIKSEFMFRELNNAHMTALHAEIMSRPNALKGYYARAKNNFGINSGREESFPSSFPARLPIVGRMFGASDYFFNALALRTRADMADMLIRQARKEGVDIADNEMMSALGEMVSAFTGRGKPFGTEALEGKPADTLNKLFFSPRFVGSRMYTVGKTFTSPFVLTKKNATFAERTAAKYAAKSALTTLGTLLVLHQTAQMFWGEQSGVDGKIGSTAFGTLRVGDYSYDLTGGHASYIALVGRTVDGMQGVKYDPRLGIYKPLGFGENTVGILTDFVLNKTSPGASIAKDVLNGHQFGGDDIDTTYFLKSMLVPITIENVVEASDSSYSDAFMVWIADSLGVSSREMKIRPMTKEWKALKEASPEKYEQAMNELNIVLWSEIEQLRNDDDFEKLTRAEQDEEINQTADKIKTQVANSY